MSQLDAAIRAAIRRTWRHRVWFAVMFALSIIGFTNAVRTGREQDWPTLAAVWAVAASIGAAAAIAGFVLAHQRLRELRQELTRIGRTGVGA